MDPAKPLIDCQGKAWADSDFAHLEANFAGIKDVFDCQGKYIECLMNTTKQWNHIISPEKYITETVKLFLLNKENKIKDVMKFRDIGFPSAITGKTAPCSAPSKTWLANLDEADCEFFRTMCLTDEKD